MLHAPHSTKSSNRKTAITLSVIFRLRANECNNSQQCSDLQCIVGRIQTINLCKPCVMSMRGPNNVERAVLVTPCYACYPCYPL